MMKNCEYQQIDPRALSVSPASAPQSPAETTAQRSRRKWEVFPGRNRFFCDGRIILASQSGVLPLTLGLIVVTCGLFFAFDCPFLVQHLTAFIPVIAAVLFVFVVISLLRTSFTDPGILPRATPDEAADIEKQIDTSGSSTYRPPPRTKEILINQQVVKLKYCFTCKMFRPPRTSHCSLCDNCVERFDHHCPWVGNCVGKRNYRFFYSFIISLSFLTSFIFGCVITHITLRSQAVPQNGLYPPTGSKPFSFTLQIKGSWSSKRGAEESGNPHSYNSIITNCCATLCGPMPPSLIDRRGVLPPDEAISAASASEIELPLFTAKNDAHMCTQSTKDVLERMVHSSDFHGLCPPGTPKTTPLGLDVSGTLAPSAEPSPSAGCSQQRGRQSVAAPCLALSRSSKRDSMHSINPAFRLASPSPSLSRTSFILGEAPDISFIPLP
ncbi:hypothetical protein F2P81_001779 [Scophthalmus maximus]|uniref:Palmitoyltransferase n=1 Tax=Scophthalmus maximus TaxID=52904 RepID=A0A6A4TNZ4_SCOMX|nr:hypothetical protein F2P81_001779 [Scophthalmus maximus]